MRLELEELKLRERHSELAKAVIWEHWFRCRVKILVVTDSSGSFDSTQNFGLGKVLDVVTSDLWPHVAFEVTTAHRESVAADLQQFKFDEHDLGQYHQIWLFGVRRAGSEITEAEVAALSRFMDEGGGVFATGDHEDLGVSMCAEVPRVRSMRRWYHPNAGPNGEPIAPDQTGIERLDTIVDTDPGTPGVQGSQTDDVPQVIRPHRYTVHWPFYKITSYPHPVLCGPDGPITHLPDHMHEGLCEVPGDLTKTYTFDGYPVEEYPANGGFRPAPEVIGWATNKIDGSEFGVIAAYDGHRVDDQRGRVVVDATWHHWFNVNMSPYLNASDPDHPDYDPAVVPQWEEMKAYFRNVAAWLCPPNTQQCLRNGGWLWAVGSYDIQITLRNLDQIREPMLYFWQLGVFARDALGRVATQCQTVKWTLPEWLESFQQLPDPWRQLSGKDRTEDLPPLPHIDLDDLTAIGLGGSVHALAQRVLDAGPDAVAELLTAEDAFRGIAAEGWLRATDVLGEHYRATCDWFDR